ncbi:MAG TPA: hypothetical protein VMS93_01550 [Candidatus Saccharimonadales bacterium]|nr:hypothetical protein [Candidatus Saccharimonadales bacterium]
MNWVRELVLGGALYLAPALALASWIPGAGALRRYGLGAALSPVVLGVTLLPLRAAGLASLPAGLVALAVWGVLALARWRALPAGPGPEERDVLRRCAWLLPLVLLPPLLNSYLLERSDAWFHAAVTFQVRNLPLPPQDPYYAGLPLQYFWFFHLILAAYDSVARMAPFTAMWLFNSAYFAIALAGAYTLARRAGASHAEAQWAPWLLALGANPFGWGWILVRLWRGHWHWGDAVGRFLPDHSLSLLTWRYASNPLAFSMDKFLVGTAFSWGLAMFVWWCVSLADYTPAGRWREAALLGGLSAAILLAHPIVGMTVYVGAAVTLGLAWLVSPSRAGLARAVVLGLFMAAGLAVVYPYLRAITQGKSGGGLPQFSVNGPMMWTTAWVAGVLLVLAARGVRTAWRAGVPGRVVLLLTAMTVGMGCSLYYDAGHNEGKFLHLGLLLLAALAAAPLRRLALGWLPAQPALRVALLACVFVPTPAFQLGSLLVSHGRSAFEPLPPPPGPAQVRVYRWIRDHTPSDAVLLVRPGSVQAPVRAQRAQVWSQTAYAAAWHYPPAEMDARRRAVDAAFGAGLGPAEQRFLAALHRPVYRLSPAGDAPPQACFQEVHREDRWVAERLRLPEAP